MSNLIVWAPNAKSVELVHRDKTSFNPPINMVPTSVGYKGTSMGGYWCLPSSLPNFPLNDGDGYWYKITFQTDEIRYRIDPYARAMNHSESYSIYKNPQAFNWTDQN